MLLAQIVSQIPSTLGEAGRKLLPKPRANVKGTSRHVVTDRKVLLENNGSVFVFSCFRFGIWLIWLGILHLVRVLAGT